MKAMILEAIGMPLRPVDRPDPVPGKGQLMLRVEACAVCRTDLHVCDGDLPNPKLPLIPGHEIVGIVEAVGEGVAPSRMGQRVGVPWLGHTCGCCSFCRSGEENLCDEPQFTGYTRDGGFASHVVANADYAFVLDSQADPVALAPLLCAGLIGWRSLKKAGDGKRIGLYGFGAAAHIIAQICLWQGREVFAFSRSGDEAARRFALGLGAVWAGGSNERPPVALDAAIIFAPVGELVPAALKVVRKGGRVVCGGIHMSDLPAMPYALIWGERSVVSVANLTRKDAEEFFPVAGQAGVRTHTKTYRLADANAALDDLRAGRLSGAAVLTP
ncbi:zinc-dependent alcohol dehydrogenase family protein [Rhizobium viscosum]|uniref:Propanol-preferring alcohol dehydrogenase n=1 Tax=Rhizobium viscosum TaxID=1673 RepID=A0ABR9J005_RHIVS|nr:zinc-dependent alcohol dehydrogenase family protein [Rhizobium viscosum]MBE1508811.1 propanol-preferring alcohol dehydrogenase [Rhizobium viscosum]